MGDNMSNNVSFMSFLRLLMGLIGVVMIVNGICLWFTTNFNLGNLLLLLFGSVLAALGFAYDFISDKVPKWLLLSVFVCLLLYALLATFLLSFGLFDTVGYDEDAVIVLGAGIRGEMITGALKGRLDAAVKYHSNNPQALIVVSGGQGPGESISEALAMQRYLIRCGVSEDKIIMEDRSTSTFENFTFSKKILDDHFGKVEYKLAYITNEYHVFRAGSIARQIGFENLTHCHSNTVWYLIGSGVLRENLAVLKHWVLGG